MQTTTSERVIVPLAFARPGFRVVLYARISEDPNMEAAGVNRQLDDEWKLAVLRGLDVVAVVSDNDISALKGKRRPGYDEALGWVRRGETDYVMCWQTSRLLRNRRERAEFIELGADKGISILVVKGMDLDLTSAYGRGTAGIMGEFDTMESEVKSERVVREVLERVESGRPIAALGFGWIVEGQGSHTTYSIHPDESEVVRDAVRSLLAGDSLKSIADRLNASGLRTPRSGALWTWTSVRAIVQRPSNVSLLVYRPGGRKKCKPEQVRTMPGCWPALVDRDEWDRVMALLSAPARRAETRLRPGGRKHLLSFGIGECGVCGGRLRAKFRTGRSETFIYTCQSRGCVGRSMELVDDLVDATMIELLQRSDYLEWIMPDESDAHDAVDKLERLTAKLSHANRRWLANKMTDEQFDEISDELSPLIAAAQAEKDRVVDNSIDLNSLEKLAGPEAEARWSELSVERKQRALRNVGVRVIIERTDTRQFNPDHVRVLNRKGQSAR